jgi:large subunit ribosomal protein L29
MKSREEIFNLTPSELETKLTELLEEMDNLQLQKTTHQITNPLRIRLVRRDIARVKTLLSEHQKGIRIAKEEKNKT